MRAKSLQFQNQKPNKTKNQPTKNPITKDQVQLLIKLAKTYTFAEFSKQKHWSKKESSDNRNSKRRKKKNLPSNPESTK